jgi:hypothetical protein
MSFFQNNLTIVEEEELVKQIASLATFTRKSLNVVRAEVLRTDIPWTEEYSDYQSGGWWTASLFNHSGNPTDVLIQDGIGVPTSLLETMPCTYKLIEGLGLSIMWARLARLEANSFLWEHVDYVDLEQVERYRLHIPITTNSSARLVIMGRSLNLTVGHLWQLSPVNPHGVCNLYGPARLHIVIDCYENMALRQLIDHRQLSDEEVSRLPSAEDTFLQQAVLGAEKFLSLGFPRVAEHHLLRLFFEYSMPVEMPYDLIIGMYASQGMKEMALSWERRKEIFLGGHL